MIPTRALGAIFGENPAVRGFVFDFEDHARLYDHVDEDFLPVTQRLPPKTCKPLDGFRVDFFTLDPRKWTVPFG
jgi:hypothetical protein